VSPAEKVIVWVMGLLVAMLCISLAAAFLNDPSIFFVRKPW
jgi:hypothetical protein